MSSLKDTIEKMKSLEAEKKNLLMEIGELKKVADARNSNLESEIASLKDEIESLKSLLMEPEKEQESSEESREETEVSSKVSSSKKATY